MKKVESRDEIEFDWINVGCGLLRLLDFLAKTVDHLSRNLTRTSEGEKKKKKTK